MSPLRRPGRAPATFAVLLLCVQLGTLTKGALDHHARCEHGEFIDVGEDELLPPLPVAREAGLSATPSDAPIGGSHRHCLAQADVDADLALRPGTPEQLAPPAGRAVPPEQRATFVRDRYRLVPKQSPPA